MKKQTVKITKKQLKACHIYIFQQLTDIAMKHWSVGMDLENIPGLKEKNGNIEIDVRKKRVKGEK